MEIPIKNVTKLIKHSHSKLIWYALHWNYFFVFSILPLYNYVYLFDMFVQYLWYCFHCYVFNWFLAKWCWNYQANQMWFHWNIFITDAETLIVVQIGLFLHLKAMHLDIQLIFFRWIDGFTIIYHTIFMLEDLSSWNYSLYM